MILAPLKLDVIDRIKIMDKKEHAVITIFNDNKTSDTGVINCYDRTFSRNGMTYMVISHRNIYDPEFKSAHFYYYANRTCPIEFQKGELAKGEYDAKLIDSTIQMKVIESLSATSMELFIKILLIVVLIMFVILIVDTVTLFKLVKSIGGA